MLSDRFYMRNTDIAPVTPGWKILVWTIIAVFAGNALAQGWLPMWHAKVLEYLVAGPYALAHGRVWTVLTYALVETNWFWGPLNILFLWIIGRMVEADGSRRQFLTLCAGCAALGAVAWLPLHWPYAGGLAQLNAEHPGAMLLPGCSVLVLGLLTYWCFTAPDVPLELRLFFVIPVTVRPRVFFWVLLTLQAGAFLAFELPSVLGYSEAGGNYSAYLGAMLAGWLRAWWPQRAAARRPWGAVPVEETAPQRWLQKAMQVGSWSGVGRSSGGGVMQVDKPAFANRREARQEVDRILDKINVEGFGALSAEERQVLDKAKDWLGK